jgi:hypothetical protein
MQRLDIHIGRRWEDKDLFGGSATTSVFKNPFLPVQENLIVFQDLVIADVLQPTRSQSH